MRLLRTALILLCSVFVAGTSYGDSVLHDTQSQRVHVSQLKNKWIILNYWASWCGFCIKEIPELNNFYAHNKDKTIVLYGVNYDRLAMPDLKTAAAKINIRFPVLVEDPSQVWALEETDVLPVTYIINPKGKVVKEIIGPSTERSLLDILSTLKQASAKT